MCLSCFLISVTGSSSLPLFAVFFLLLLLTRHQDYAHSSCTHVHNGSMDYDPSQKTGRKCYIAASRRKQGLEIEAELRKFMEESRQLHQWPPFTHPWTHALGHMTFWLHISGLNHITCFVNRILVGMKRSYNTGLILLRFSAPWEEHAHWPQRGMKDTSSRVT